MRPLSRLKIGRGGRPRPFSTEIRKRDTAGFQDQETSFSITDMQTPPLQQVHRQVAQNTAIAPSTQVITNNDPYFMY